MLSKRKRVPPFGHPRIKAYWQLPEAYRSLSRPSSALYAKASIKCPYFAYFPNLCAEINLHMTLVFEFKILSYLEILNLFAFPNFTLKCSIAFLQICREVLSFCDIRSQKASSLFMRDN